MEITLNISELAIITGDNPYKNVNEYIIELWKKTHREDYDEYASQYNVSVKKTDYEQIKSICKDTNIDFDKKIAKNLSKTNKNITDLNATKKLIDDTVNSIQDVTKKAEIKKSLESYQNKSYGTKNETEILNHCMQQNNIEIHKDDIFRKKLIHENRIVWKIGGKIDGIDSNNNIYEIKNRVHKLFYTLRDYEKVQIMSYLYLHDTTSGFLVEALKNIGDNGINMIPVEYDDDYMQNNIIAKVVRFADFFENFIYDRDYKIHYLQNLNYECV